MDGMAVDVSLTSAKVDKMLAAGGTLRRDSNFSPLVLVSYTGRNPLVEFCVDHLSAA